MIKWVIRLAFLTGLLGVIGTLIIIININKNKEEARTGEGYQKPDAPVKISKPATDTVITMPLAKSYNTTITAKQDTAQKTDTPSAQKTPVAKTETLITKTQTPIEKFETPIAKSTIKANEPKIVVSPRPATGLAKPFTNKANAAKSKPIAARKKEEKEVIFNKGELQLILNRLFMAKVRNMQRIDCVQLDVTAKGNNKKKAAQLFRYLKRRGFTIEGREVIDENIRGFKISPLHGCLKLILGSF